jgi:Arc/MetJ-type ribon-helix-helix transcriptional regulator
MNLTLAAAQKQFVDAQVKSGRYVDASEVVRGALRLMEARHAFDHRFPGDLSTVDIEALAFTVLMESVKSAREDLKDIMAGVKAINAAKATLREILLDVRRDCAANPTRREGETLDLSRGLGSERAHHQVLLPHLDPDGPGGVRMVKTDLHPGRIVRPQDLHVALEAVTTRIDDLSEMGEMESLRLQMAMDRMSKMMSTLSNLLKKMSETSSAIVQNIK